MKLEKFIPSAALMPFVKEYLVIETGQGTESRTIPGIPGRSFLLKKQTDLSV
jgi:hypothetical protein